MVGGKDSASGWEEIGTSSSCLEASISDNSTASRAAFLPGLEMPATWGARSHPKTNHGHDMNQEMGEQKQISCRWVAWYSLPAWTQLLSPRFSWAGVGRGGREREGVQSREALRCWKGEFVSFLRLGTLPIGGTVQVNVIPATCNCSQDKTIIQGICEYKLNQRA